MIAPLLLVKAAGAIDADISLNADGGRQGGSVKATLRNVAVETTRVGSASADLAFTDLRGVPGVSGTATANSIALGSFIVTRLTANAQSQAGGRTAFRIDAGMPKGSAQAAGAIIPAGGAFDLRLDTLALRQQGISASLASPVTIAQRPDGVHIPRTVLQIGQGGSVSVSGVAGQKLDLDAAVNNLPLSLANAFSNGLGASGSVSATARIGGTSAAPVADFDVRGQGLGVAALRQAGVPALSLAASGKFADNTVSLQSTVTGAGGLSVRANGRVPLAGPGLDMQVNGSAPLTLANAMLRERGARMTGTLTLNARAGGSIAQPNVSGQASIAGATFFDPDTNMRLTGIGTMVRFTGDRATIERFSATTQGGGTLGVTGGVGLTGDLPANIVIVLRNAKLSDGRIATVQLSGRLTVTGGLLATPTLGGRIDIARAEIIIPERFATNAALLGVKNVAPPPRVRRTLSRVKAARGKPAKRRGGGGAPLALDLMIDAPSKIFVRGRGIDAELGGRVRLTGPVTAVRPVGGFSLRRGLLSVVGQTITLTSGNVVLAGDLNPTIDIVATTRSQSLVVTARVTGEALDPQLILSSTPELPQDEVLAHFLFGRSISDLSPLQLVQLATAVAQLAGGSSGPDLLGSVRKATGLDSLNVVTDSKGNAALQAGRYIGEKIYLGVTTGADGAAAGTINLDVTRHLKLRGEAGTDGGKAGFYYEREY